jgi:hypothetical protein
MAVVTVPSSSGLVRRRTFDGQRRIKRPGPILPDVGSLDPSYLVAAHLLRGDEHGQDGSKPAGRTRALVFAHVRMSPAARVGPGRVPTGDRGARSDFHGSPHEGGQLMRSWKRPPALALIAAAAVALAAVALVATHGLLHVVVMAVLVAALVGGYLLRRYARASLLYDRHRSDDRRSTVPVTSAETGRGSMEDRRDRARIPRLPMRAPGN